MICSRLCGDSDQSKAKIAVFENRRAATVRVVSTGSADSRDLQPAMG